MKKFTVKNLTLTSLLLACAIALSAAENIFLPDFLPLGVKIGLASIPVMLAMLCTGWQSALCITVLKSIFVLLMRGATAFAMSIAGGLLSFLIMLLLMKRTKTSFIMLSVCGAIAHNLAQLSVSALIMGSGTTFYYAPILLVSGVLSGIATGVILKLLIPLTSRFSKGNYYDT